MPHLKATHSVWRSWLTGFLYHLWDGVNVSFILLMCSHTLIHSALLNLLSHPLFPSTDIQCTLKMTEADHCATEAPLPQLSGKGSSMLGELMGCCKEGRVLISTPHTCALGRAGIHKARWDKWLVWQFLPFVCCRWSCWRDCHGAVLSWLSSWTC